MILVLLYSSARIATKDIVLTGGVNEHPNMSEHGAQESEFDPESPELTYGIDIDAFPMAIVAGLVLYSETV